MIATARTIPPPVRSVRRGIARLAAAGLGMALGATAPTAAVAADDWVAQLADGEPWSVRMPNGRTASMTLDPDGTGRMHAGPIRMRVDWSRQGDGICLDTIRTGMRCMTLERAASGGLVGRGVDGIVQFAR